MLPLLIALVGGVATLSGLLAGWDHPIWSVVIAVAVFALLMLLLNLLFRKPIQAVFNAVQEAVLATQEDVQRRIRMIQNKNMSGGKGLQKQIEKMQADGIRAALVKLDDIKPLQRWNLLAEKQANTLRAQLCYQIKDFEAADKAFENILPMRIIPDPLIVAMQMVRLYKNEKTKELDKLFKGAVKVFKDEKGTILYALRSWIMVQEEQVDEAIVLLDKAKETTENDMLRKNWEHLANGRIKRFSNAALGDQWYALHLEQPKMQRAQQQRFGGRVKRR